MFDKNSKTAEHFSFIAQLICSGLRIRKESAWPLFHLAILINESFPDNISPYFFNFVLCMRTICFSHDSSLFLN